MLRARPGFQRFAIVLCLALFAASSTAFAAKKMPAFKVKTWITNKSISAKELMGRPYVVEFWATWCPPCRKSIPHLNALSKKYPDLPMIGLTSEPASSIKKLKAFAKRMKMSYYVGVNRSLGSEIGVRGIPHAVVVDFVGDIIWSGHPSNNAFEASMKKALAEWPLAGVKLPTLGKTVRAILAGTAPGGVKKLLSMRSKEAREARAVLDKAAAKMLKSALAGKDDDPTAAAARLDRIATVFTGLDVAAKAKSAADAIRKAPGFEDEKTVISARKRIMEDFNKELRAALVGKRGRNAQIKVALPLFEKLLTGLDALIKKYPKAKALKEVRNTKAGITKMIGRLKAIVR